MNTEQIKLKHKVLILISSITCYFNRMSSLQEWIWCWEAEAISISSVYFMQFMGRTTTSTSAITLHYRSVHSLPSLQALHLLQHSQWMKFETAGVLMRENYSLMTGQHRDVDDDIQSRVCCVQSRVILQVTYIHTCLLQLSKPGGAKLTLHVANGSSIKQTSDNRGQEISTLTL